MRTRSSNANAQATSGAQREDGSGEKPAIDPLSQVCIRSELSVCL